MVEQAPPEPLRPAEAAEWRRPKSWRRMLLNTAIILAVLYGLWLVAGCAFQRRILYPRHIAGSGDAEALEAEPVERMWVDTPEGKVEGWYIHGEGVTEEEPGPAVLFAHGNGELIDDVADQLMPYRALGVSVLVGEYRGYGRSAGAPSQAKITSDFLEFADWLAERPEVDADRLVFHGRSLGAGVVCSVARQRAPAAMILQSPFTSVRAMAGRYLFPAFLVSDPYDNAAVVRDFERPVLIVHGRRDEVVPVRHGRRLHELAPQSTYREWDCGHNDFPFDSERHWRVVESFLVDSGVLKENPTSP